jgi:SAM-dependent methyltransferase
MNQEEFNYEQSWALKEAPVDIKESARIRETLALIPADARNVLDAGCGDGRVLAQLAARYNVYGVDVSYNALARETNRRRTVGVLSDLPFRDGCFDLVLVSEVIEHIPLEVLQRVLSEVSRVSRKYILITVPYRESLEEANVRCTCGFVFHKWGHLQAFDERKVASLYSGIPLRKLAYIGEPKRADPRLFKKLRQDLGGRYAPGDPDTLCPKCGGSRFTVGRRNIPSMLFGAAGLLAGRLMPQRRATWIGALFEKPVSA